MCRSKNAVSYTHLDVYKRQAAERKNTDIAAGLLNQGKANGQVVRKTTKIYPNDPCPCGSGKKYKKCCGKNQA